LYRVSFVKEVCFKKTKNIEVVNNAVNKYWVNTKEILAKNCALQPIAQRTVYISAYDCILSVWILVVAYWREIVYSLTCRAGSWLFHI